MPLINLENLVKSYRVDRIEIPVLRGITLQINKGEYVALMGSSGSGKSTLMNILGCLDRPSSGLYMLDGQDTSTLSADERASLRNQRFGFVFQSFNLLSRTNALDNVMMPMEYSRVVIPDDEARSRATVLLTKVGLGDRLQHVPSQLSGGQQQRVAIARALINHPSILLADEPTGNLDSKSTDEIIAMFDLLHSREGMTIILVTHENDVAVHAKRIIKLKDGRIEHEESNPGSLKQSPIAEVTG